MTINRRNRGRPAVVVAAATFDPYSRSLLLATESQDREAWITVALVFFSLLLFGVVAS